MLRMKSWREGKKKTDAVNKCEHALPRLKGKLINLLKNNHSLE